MFPMVESAIDFALDHQHPTGEIEWDADPARVEGKGALLTGSSSIYSSLRCAIAAAERLGRDRPDWELSLGSLAIAIAHRPERFLDKERWAMDWYYPILSGVLRGHAAEARFAAKWGTFVAAERGVRCVSDQPWVTAAETCELVLALDAIGLHERAHELFRWVQFLRDDDGAYWTGMNFPDDRFDEWGDYFTPERPTWNSAAVVLAANALGGRGPASGLFRGEGLAGGPHRRGADRGGRGHRGRAVRPQATLDALPRGSHESPSGADGRSSARHAAGRRNTRSDPVVDDGAKPSATARCHTRYGACPPSLGSSNTSWIASVPPGATCGDQSA